MLILSFFSSKDDSLVLLVAVLSIALVERVGISNEMK